MRSFIAIEVPDEIKKEMVKVQEQLRTSKVEASWSRPEGVHLTLKFLGEVPESMIAEVVSALRTAAEGIGPLRLAIKGAGTFPNLKTVRVVWIGFSGDVEKLTKLQLAVEDAMVRIGMAREERKFIPHLTLGRIKHIRSRELWFRALDEIKDVSLPGFEVLAVSLMKSELKPSGVVYTEIAHIKLGT